MQFQTKKHCAKHAQDRHKHVSVNVLSCEGGHHKASSLHEGTKNFPGLLSTQPTSWILKQFKLRAREQNSNSNSK